MLIKPSNENLYYTGRIDFSNPEMPKIYYAASSVRMNFKGSAVKARIKNYYFYNVMELGVVVDGKVSKVGFGRDYAEYELTLCEGLDESKAHELVFYKRQDATHWFEFLGFEILGENPEILPPPAKPRLKIEVYGDSVSAGAVVEAVDYVGSCDPENSDGAFDNSWYSYSSIVARNLGAELQNCSQGGIALFDGSGYYHAPDFIGVESSYDKLCYFPEGGISEWDFSRFTPDFVIFAFGQNDNHHEGHEDFDIHDKVYREKWKARYKEVLLDIDSKYAHKPIFILMTTVLMHDADRDTAIEEIRSELTENGLMPQSRLFHHMFKRNGAATPGHPRTPEQYEMAEELTAKIVEILRDNNL